MPFDVRPCVRPCVRPFGVRPGVRRGRHAAAHPYTARVSGRFDDVLTIAVLGFVGVRLATGLRLSLTGDGRNTVRTIVSKIRWRHIWPVPLVLAGVLVVAA